MNESSEPAPARESRSQLRRKAAQKGEPVPEPTQETWRHTNGMRFEATAEVAEYFLSLEAKLKQAEEEYHSGWDELLIRIATLEGLLAGGAKSNIEVHTDDNGQANLVRATEAMKDNNDG